MHISRLCCIAAALLVLHGCGYSLVTEKGIFGGEITTVSVPVFRNMTLEPHVPLFFTDSFHRELTASGLFDVNRPSADASLQGTIKKVRIDPSSLSVQGLAVEKSMTIEIALVLSKQGNVIKTWTFGDSEAYRVDNINQEDFNKREAFRRIANRMARRFHSLALADY